MLVPSESPSGSLFRLGSYVSVPCATPETVKVADSALRCIRGLDTEHVPPAVVTHETAVPVVVNVPLTVASLTVAPLATSTTVIVTEAAHPFF
jgi:hypothetical protein